ncbi:MAG: host attachment protein [Myxococcales bacterium]|nr:host attachment protein [Myxococcales bacterium]
MSSNITWILVADASRARLFASEGGSGPWAAVDALVHPESRAKGIDLAADRPGRVQQRTTEGRASMEAHTHPKEVEAEQFAHELAARLHAGHGDGSYRDVVLVAPPHFLGLLRGALDEQVARKVRASVDKDLTFVPDRELPERLAGELG